MVRADRAIADYDALFDPIREARKEKDGNQLGDPNKLGQAVLTLVASDDPPPQLLLGSDALTLVRQRLSAIEAEISKWEPLTRSTDGCSS
ncbi:hypothetical protein ACIGGE_13650 [Qipengyuania sp. NPDC077410]|uniref:hypothetical protein n=1 Tax=Qipengyuania sp. NPDC077410 TaxID=3364496 RepID=UPI0037CB4165